MTCICAIGDGRRVHMAGDSAISVDSFVVGNSNKMITRAVSGQTGARVVMGFSGSLAAAQLFMYRMDMPAIDTRFPYQWIHQHLVPTMRVAIASEDMK
ncbi:MAG: hypothetical protein DI607_14515, partial [Sphingomonas hengshuiensis]